MTTTADTGIASAIDRLTRVRDLQDAIAGLRRVLAQLDEDARAASVYAERAGLTERMIADRLGVSQPTVHGWLDARRGEPTAAPSLAAEAWQLHGIATALRGLVARMEGRHLSETSPSSHHSAPVSAARNARKGAEEAERWLSSLAAALDYEAGATPNPAQRAESAN